MTRFTGTIEELCDVDVREFVDWLRMIPVSDWRRLADDSWYDWGMRFGVIAHDLTQRFYPGCRVSGIGVFILEPGQDHPAHTDVQPDSWLARIHIPLITNEHVTATMDDGVHRMEVGKAYRFNTLATHAVANHGTTHRAHFVFDIHR